MAYSKPLNLLDLSFVLMETRQTPMHVAGLQTFVPPPDAPRDFARQLFEYLRSFPVTAPPFNYRLRGVGPGRLLPSWDEVAKVDLDYHLRHIQLPEGSDVQELLDWARTSAMGGFCDSIERIMRSFRAAT